MLNIKIFRAASLAGFALLTSGASFAQNYTETVLTSDGSVAAANTDPNLVNPWGIARSTTADWWLSDNATGLSTLYDAAGVPQSLVVTIPSSSGTGPGSPSGAIYYGGTSFTLSTGNPAIFLFCTEDGTISGWNPGVNSGAAIVKVNHPGAVYKGLTVATINGTDYLYVTNFRNATVEVYDGNFNPVSMDTAAFTSNTARKRGFSPYNVQNIGGTMYVTFAQQNAAHHDSVSGAGLGFVAAFTPTGSLVHEFQYGSYFNAPWAIALAPSDFGSFSHDVLIGNFGSGQILAFNAQTGAYQGILADPEYSTDIDRRFVGNFVRKQCGDWRI